jgi:hypothetical protein
LNGSFEIERPTLHGAGEEARIEQVQDRVLDAADILIDRQPVVGGLRIGRTVAARRGEAGEVPGRIDEGVHGVGFAQGRLAAFRAMVLRQVGWRSSGLPGLSKLMSSGS